MGPRPACGQLGGRQGKAQRSFASRARPRICLLKGCERSFLPERWSQRYCSESCRTEARVWQGRKAAWEYRRSEQGKAKRAAQSRRRRERQKLAESGEEVGEGGGVAESTPLKGREGHPPFVGAGDFCCNRPGCYTLFDRPPRSPLQRFCRSACYRAIRRVKVREAQWQARALLQRKFECSTGRQAVG
jgi:hypothetical protein